MQLNNKPLLYILLAIIPVSCIEPYFPDDISYEPMVFIQALVTDNPDTEPYVQISNTQPLMNGQEIVNPYIDVNGATVYIERDDATRYYFAERPWWGFGGGYYYLPDPSFTLTPGSSYMLVVETSEGHLFESGYEPYMSPIEIEDIGYKYAVEQEGELGTVSEGYKFNISTSGEGTIPGYYRWELDQTYYFMVPLRAYYMWDGRRIIDSSSYDITFCYKDDYIKGIYVGTTSGLSENRVTESPLHFVSQYGEALQIEYSLHVQQYRISENVFQFWLDMRKLLYETGGLYETQPFRISGNISCVSDPPVDIAGVFEVAAVSEKRIYVPRPTDFTIYAYSCFPDTVGSEVLPWEALQPGAWMIDLDDGVWQSAPSVCFDCTLRGGYLEKPPFWEK